MVGFGDAVAWTDGNGNPGDAAAQPDRQPQPARRAPTTVHASTATSATAPTRPRPASVRSSNYLGSLPYHPSPNCAPNTYYYLNNTNPAYRPTAPQDAGTLSAAHPQRSIADSLNEKGISWKFYGGGLQRDGQRRRATARSATRSSTDVDHGRPGARATHIKDTSDMYADIDERHAAGGLVSSSRTARSTATRRRRSSICSRHTCRTSSIGLRRQPGAEASTAIFVTLDEGGGYYDSGYIQPVDFFGDGPRIPMIVVSPYSTRRQDHHDYTDHVVDPEVHRAQLEAAPASPRRSRDNLPNPAATDGQPVRAAQHAGDRRLFEAFDFDHFNP